jgi:hypothetical protein
MSSFYLLLYLFIYLPILSGRSIQKYPVFCWVVVGKTRGWLAGHHLHKCGPDAWDRRTVADNAKDWGHLSASATNKHLSNLLPLFTCWQLLRITLLLGLFHVFAFFFLKILFIKIVTLQCHIFYGIFTSKKGLKESPHFLVLQFHSTYYRICEYKSYSKQYHRTVIHRHV